MGHLHRGLADQLDLDSYRTEIAGRVSLQTCSSDANGDETEGTDFRERLGDGAVYAFVYPNFMINRYGPVMDTNWAVQRGLRSSAFDRGPYAPRVEQAAHHFHCLLKEDLERD